MLIHIMILKFTHGIKNNHHNFVQIILAPTPKIGHLLHLFCRNATLIFKNIYVRGGEGTLTCKLHWFPKF